MSGLKTYYALTKPGIIYGNLITAAAGFFLASKHHFFLGLLVETLAGIALVIASACVFNNYLDRGIDQKMARTKNRALVTNRVSPRSALVFASALGIAGLFILSVLVNFLVAGLCFFALFFYVVLYGWGKRRTVHGTLIGSFPGAIPPAAGYVAVTGHIDAAAAILFLILIFWQMPHFYAIAMYRYEDYKRAGLPVLTVRSGMQAARLQIFIYIAGFMAIAGALFVFGYAGYTYLAAALLLGVYWLWQGAVHLKGVNDTIWGRKMFLTSLIVNLGISIFIAVGSLLP